MDRVSLNRTRPAVAGMVVFAAALASGCGASSKEEKTLSESQVISKAAEATVAVVTKVDGKKYRGSGVVYDARRGLVLTSTETIWDRDSIQVVTSDSRELHARLAARSPCDDVSVLVLHPRPPGLSEMKPSGSRSVKAGDDVTALGYPERFQTRGKAAVSSTKGRVSAAYVSADLQPLLPTFPQLIQHQAPLASGTSGGPLIDRKGAFVGLNTTLASKEGEAVGYAVASPHLREMLAELKPTKRFIFGGWKKRHYCHDQFEQIIRKKRGHTPRGGGDEAHH